MVIITVENATAMKVSKGLYVNARSKISQKILQSVLHLRVGRIFNKYLIRLKRMTTSSSSSVREKGLASVESALVIWKIQALESMESSVAVILACVRTPVEWSALATGNVIVRATAVRAMTGGKAKTVRVVKSMIFKSPYDISYRSKHELLYRRW